MAGKFKADHVGSLLRPPELLEARLKFENGQMSQEDLRVVEDRNVLKALEVQREAGIDIYTEGEYRRANWGSAIRTTLEGVVPVEMAPSNTVLGAWQGPNAALATQALAETKSAQVAVAGKIRKKGRFTAVEAGFLKEHAPGPWKITMPGPMSAVGGLYRPGMTDPYYTREELLQEIIGVLQDEVRGVLADGVSYFQLDSLHYVERITDDNVRGRMVADGEDPERYLDQLIAADNAVLDIAKAGGVTVGLHMCRGNNRSAWHAEGSYEIVAEKAFNQLNVDRFLLEYDTDRAGGFEPLRFMPKNKTVVLGLISSKLPGLESVELLKRRIEEATKYVPLENLAISPQCGFASTAQGNLLTWDEMRRKLELVVQVARDVWG